jgi:hypothetical protein
MNAFRYPPMKTSFLLQFTAAFFCAAAMAGVARAQSTASTDPRITSWLTTNSARYARVYETTADKNSGNAVSTWPRAGLTNRGGGVSTATYSDVQRVAYSDNFVYIQTSGLASYTMGPWLDPNGGLFGMWPTNRAAIHRIPRNPTIPTTKVLSRGSGGVLVNGVFVWNAGDAQSYTTSTGQVSMQGQGIWNRLAGAAEIATFDAGNAHQPGNGQYHNHINPRALRYQLGDNVTFNAATNTYAEAGTPTRHSPIIGWATDGLPIYGPYGYASAMNAASGVRRMTSGFVKRDGTNGTTNLTATGRTTLAKWSAEVQSRSQMLATTEYGPAVSAAQPIGTFFEDYDYLGDLGKTQGVDFDLNRQNVRFGVTPEYPNGTYAYFTTIDAAGNSAFPDIINLEYFGATQQGQGTVNAITEAVTDYVIAGPAATINVTAVAAGSAVLVSWNSAEGATYKVESSSDNATWTPLSTSVTSAGTTTTFTATTTANYYRVTLTAIATYDTRSSPGTPVGITGSRAYAGTSVVGATGTARLINIATRVQVGGSAGTPISGFVIAGSGSTRMLVRAVGPTLATFNVTGALADPAISIVSGSTTVATNDNWNAVDSTMMTASGAFALSTGSRDAAIVATLSSGAYSSPVTANGGSGVALLELYDASSSTDGPTLVNASTRAFVGSGDQVLIPGFVVSGTGTVKLLVRAVGPTLANFGVTGTLADPQITLYRGSTVVATNDNWSSAANAAEIASTATQVGAFALTSGSRDAAVLTTLEAGSYTAVVSGVASTTGTALVELYVVQ